MEQQDKIILIGAGNVAHHLAGALLKAGENLCQIYSRTLDSARQLGMKTGISYTAEVNEVYPDGDIYIFCVSDDILPSIIKAIRIPDDALILHTSGIQLQRSALPGKNHIQNQGISSGYCMRTQTHSPFRSRLLS